MAGKFSDKIKYLLWKLDLDVKRRKSFSTFESNVIEAIRRYAIDLVVDVGANIGQFGMLMRDLGYDGEIISFEPVESAFEELWRVAKKDPHWTAYKHCLGERNDVVDLNVFEGSVFSSILKPNETGKKQFRNLKKSSPKKTELRRLDAILPTRPDLLGRRILLKMDTQGYDDRVFSGATNLLPSVWVLISEVSFNPIYETAVKWQDAIEIFENAGFAVSGLFPVSRLPDLSLLEGNLVMIKASQNDWNNTADEHASTRPTSSGGMA